MSADVAAVSSAGRSWWAERRLAAFERFEKTSLPTEDEEDWRYGRISELDLEEFAPVDGQLARQLVTSGLSATVAELLEVLGPRSGRLRSIDGYAGEIELDAKAEASGVVLSSLAALADAAPADYGELLASRPDAFTALGEAFAGDPAVLVVPAGVRLEHPVVIVHELGSSAPGGRAPASFPRTFVSLGEGAEASVVEVFLSGRKRRLVVPATELVVGVAAHLRYQSVQLLGRATWQLAYQASRVARDATLVSFAAALGGDYARLATHSALVGENAESQLLAVYLGDGTQVQDLRTFQDHAAARTRSELVYKGAVAGEARSVYTGLIHMRRGARRSEASQTNRNLVLSEGAHADSVPNLDIEENDVRCSHASAVGPIDAEQRFYVESRGVPPEIAERLILLGFYDDLLERAPGAGLARWLRDDVATRLAGEVAPVESADEGVGADATAGEGAVDD